MIILCLMNKYTLSQGTAQFTLRVDFASDVLPLAFFFFQVDVCNTKSLRYCNIFTVSFLSLVDIGVTRIM